MNIFFELFKLAFKKDVQEMVEKSEQVGVRKGIEIENERIDNQRRDYQALEFQDLVGKPVIAISNEWQNPVIGIATRVEFITQAKSPVLIVQDYLLGEEYLVMGTVFHYTEQRLEALSKLTPFEICSFLYGRYLEGDFEKNKSTKYQFDGYDVIRQKLIDSGFYQDIEKLKAKESEQA